MTTAETVHHVVRQQTLELTLPERPGAHGLQEEARRIARGDLATAMDELFSGLVATNEVIELDRVEIDLGDLASTALNEELVKRARLKLEEALSRQIAVLRSSPPGERQGARILSSEQSYFELLRVFLLSGTVPLWAPGGISANLETVFRELLETASADVASMLRHIAVPRVLTRIAKQFSPATRRQLRAALAPSHAKEIEQAITEWEHLLSGEEVAGGALPSSSRPSMGFRPAGEQQIRQYVESAVLRLLTSRTQDDVTAGDVSEYIVKQVAAETDSSQGLIVAQLREILYIVLPANRVVRNWLEKGTDSHGDHQPKRGRKAGTPVGHSETQASEGTREPARGSKPGVFTGYRKEQTSHGPARDSAWKVATHDTKRDMEHRDVESAEAATSVRDEEREDLSREDGAASFIMHISSQTGSLAPLSESADTAPPPPLVTQPIWLEASESRQTVAGPNGESLVAEEGQYIENAGLVLLWSYLTRFLEATGLVENKAFHSEATKERAVLLLQHIATGETEWPEPVLLLNKVLCGWPIDEPVANSIDVTEMEAEESRELLAYVVRNWKALKSTSVEGLRSSFLQREGHLVLADEGWKLKVARTGYDVLLDQLPWGIGFVLLPWMDQPLFAEW